jgi:hypothetical protein
MKNKYKYVYFSSARFSFKACYHAKIEGEFSKCYPTERDAALAIDKHLIGKGRPPVNILKSLKLQPNATRA